MKRWFALGLVLVCMSMALFMMGRQNPSKLQRAISSGEMMRIHILAHDDTEAQQALKLQVRDNILATFTPMFSQVETAQEAAEIVRENMDEAVRIAAATVRETGYSMPICAEYGVFEFPERIYGKEVVPAGNYTALRIRLGDAQGKNWWCVMYPPLCFSGEDYEGEIVFESKIWNWLKKGMKKTARR